MLVSKGFERKLQVAYLVHLLRILGIIDRINIGNNIAPSRAKSLSSHLFCQFSKIIFIRIFKLSQVPIQFSHLS